MSKARLTHAAALGGMLCMGAVAIANPPSVSNVTLDQPAGTRVVAVGYETDGISIPTFQLMTNDVDICHSEVVRTVTGDINQLLPAGAYSFTWDAGRDFPEQILTNLTVEIRLWTTNHPPLYCAVNLVFQDGKYPVFWYGKESEVPFGVNNSWWKNDWLLLRQIPATEGEFVTLGSPPAEPGRDDIREAQRNIRITKPFYLGVFPVTQRQWQMVYGGTLRPSYFNNPESYQERPVERLNYNSLRGSVAQGYNWPTTGHAVGPTSYTGLLRARTGSILAFDLPTEAQWEYACRAGTSGAWNNGTTRAPIVNVDANLDLLGRYRRNGGYIGGTVVPDEDCSDEYGTARVGSYPPNAWGLYDMHGNVWEFTLDWIVEDATDPSMSGDDPAGPLTGSSRTLRGGAWNYNASDNRAARRGSATPSTVNSYFGARIAATAEVFITQ